MKKSFEALMLVSLVLLLSLSAGAEPGGQPPLGPPPGGPPPQGSPLDHALESVELPEDVRKDVDALLDESHRTRRGLRRSLHAAHEQMRSLLDAEEPNEAAILEQADAIGKLQTSLDKDRLVTLPRIRARLSPEQRGELTRALEERGKRPRRNGPRRR